MGVLGRIGIALIMTITGFAMIGSLPDPFPWIVMGFGGFVILLTIWEFVYAFATDLFLYLRYKPRQNKNIIPLQMFLRQARRRGWDTRPSHPQTPVLLRELRAAADFGRLRMYGRRGDTPIRTTLEGHQVDPIPANHWIEFQIDIRSIAPNQHNSKCRTLSPSSGQSDVDAYFDLHVYRADAKKFLKRRSPKPIGDFQPKRRKRKRPSKAKPRPSGEISVAHRKKKLPGKIKPKLFGRLSMVRRKKRPPVRPNRVSVVK
jgi:hypothetical protein